jgi:hypothetical protein
MKLEIGKAKMHIRQAERKKSDSYREEEVSIPRNNRRREVFVDLVKHIV